MTAVPTPEGARAPVLEPERPPAVPGSRRQRRRGRGYQRSGFYALKATIRTLGPRLVDRRTSLGKALAQWKADLVRDLGGDPSTQQLAVIDLAVKSKLLLDSIDAWLLVQPSLVNARKKALLPVVRERQQLADGLARYLAQLGLERRAQPVEKLSDYLARRDRASVPAGGVAATATPVPVDASRGPETTDASSAPVDV